MDGAALLARATNCWYFTLPRGVVGKKIVPDARSPRKGLWEKTAGSSQEDVSIPHPSIDRETAGRILRLAQADRSAA